MELYVIAERALQGVMEFRKETASDHNVGNQSKNPVKEPNPKGVCTMLVGDGLIVAEVITFGCVVKDHNQQVIVVACLKKNLCVVPCLAEMLAIRWSLNLVKGLGCNKVLIQPDSSSTVDCINSVMSITNFDHIALDCRVLLNSFSMASVTFLSRLYNVDAHHMACLAKTVGSRTWCGCLPSGNPSVSLDDVLA